VIKVVVVVFLKSCLFIEGDCSDGLTHIIYIYYILLSVLDCPSLLESGQRLISLLGPCLIILSRIIMFVCLFVSMGIRGKPRMYLSLAGFLYRPHWTFQLWPPDAPAPTDVFRTPMAEVGTYGRGNKDR
jgi:hypothetical protein